MEPSDADVIAASLAEPAAFGAIFDRHASTILRYFGRRVEPAAAEGLLGEVFRIAFEQRASFDPSRASARPWLYGIAANLVGRHRRSERRRLHAMARLAARQPIDQNDVVGEHAAGSLDAAEAWSRLAGTVDLLPAVEREALLLFAWENLSYDDIADALGVPSGPCVRDSTGPGVGYANTIRASAPEHPGLISPRPTPMTDELDPLRRLRADDLLPTDPPDAELLAAARRRLLAGIAGTPSDDAVPLPSVYTRLAYRDERAALEFLERAFGFRELRESRMEHPDGMLAWLQLGNGVIMIGRSGTQHHGLTSPIDAGATTAMVMVYVDDIDAHHRQAVAEGATIVSEPEDMFWGDRRYEAFDSEGHRWHFAQRLRPALTTARS